MTLKLRKTTIAAICVSAAAAAAISFSALSSKEKIPVAEPDLTVVNGYYLVEHNGKIGVFTPGISEPIMVIDVNVNTLPDHDREALENGIYARDEEELNKRIEDYSS